MVRNVYKYILIDEFQDINKVQFEVLKLISSPLNNIFAVGDEDQSIYGFRGARPDFCLNLNSTLIILKIILDINYRSKSEIVHTANRLIDKIRIDMKKLLCSQGDGGSVTYISPHDSEEEALYIAKEIIDEIKKIM